MKQCEKWIPHYRGIVSHPDIAGWEEPSSEWARIDAWEDPFGTESPILQVQLLFLLVERNESDVRDGDRVGIAGPVARILLVDSLTPGLRFYSSQIALKRKDPQRIWWKGTAQSLEPDLVRYREFVPIDRSIGSVFVYGFPEVKRAISAV